MTTLGDFSAAGPDGHSLSLAGYLGQVVLIVNTASECGYTRQYAGLQSLYELFRQEGFVVLGFPCDQFGGQEPGSDAQIASFCTTRFGVTFPLFAKGNVNGHFASPLWQWLTSAGSSHPHPVKWNFTKFLIDRNGDPVARYAPQTKPEELEMPISKLL